MTAVVSSKRFYDAAHSATVTDQQASPCHVTRVYIPRKTDDELALNHRNINHRLECGPMPNVMVALPNIGGALYSTPQTLADAH